LLLRAFAGIVAAIAGTAAYARGWGAGPSLALGGGLAVVGYAVLNLLVRGPFREVPPAPPLAPRGRARQDPGERRRVLTDHESDPDD
jgi:hypothetical protein